MTPEQIKELSDEELVKRFQSTDGEGEEAEALLAEIQARDLDL